MVINQPSSTEEKVGRNLNVYNNDNYSDNNNNDLQQREEELIMADEIPLHPFLCLN